MKQTVAIFGASGKLGRHALAVLARRGFAVRALVHRTPVAGPENITSVTGSITDAKAVDETVRGADIVVQLATTKEDADTFFDVSVRGTFNILEACRRQGVKQFILLRRRRGAGHLVLSAADPHRRKSSAHGLSGLLRLLEGDGGDDGAAIRRAIRRAGHGAALVVGV
jgi:uncharacterized protein YbjT (DUF2867 family)